eukprot:COSAG01_NODE_38277_length_491_cov_6.522959_1_plen_68_part_00
MEEKNEFLEFQENCNSPATQTTTHPPNKLLKAITASLSIACSFALAAVRFWGIREAVVSQPFVDLTS